MAIDLGNWQNPLGYTPSWINSDGTANWFTGSGYGSNTNIGTDTAPDVSGLDWAKFGLQTLGGLGNLYMGMKSYGAAKRQLAFQQDAFKKNYNAQAQTLNSQMEDRQRARVASNPTAYESVGSYMDKNKLKTI